MTSKRFNFEIDLNSIPGEWEIEQVKPYVYKIVYDTGEFIEIRSNEEIFIVSLFHHSPDPGVEMKSERVHMTEGKTPDDLEEAKEFIKEEATQLHNYYEDLNE